MEELNYIIPAWPSHLTKRIFRATPAKPWSERKRTRKLQAKPKLSMSISEIVERFTKGLDAGVSVAMTSDHPESQVDLERMSRMDRVEKAFTADQMRQDNERVQAELREEGRRTQEELDEQKKARIEAKKAAARNKAGGPQGPPDTGIGKA